NIARNSLLPAGHAQQLAVQPRVPTPVEAAGGKCQVERLAMQLLRIGKGPMDIENKAFPLHISLTTWAPRPACSLRHSSRRQIMGVKINCMARSIFPPGQTIVLARDMNESCSIESR